MQESGKIILRDVSRTSVFQRALGRALQEAWSVQSSPTGEVIGIRFDFGQSITPCILNWGDELYIAAQYPADAQKNELREVAIVERIAAAAQARRVACVYESSAL